jgi:hypothetical protein
MIPPSALLSFHRKQLQSAFWQADNVCLKFFRLFGECVCIHCGDCSVVSAFRNETQVSSSVTRTTWLRNSSPSLWYHSKISKAEGSHSLCSVRTCEHFRNPSCAKLVVAYRNCDNLVENSAWNLWKFTRKFWNRETQSFTIFFQHLKQDHPSLQMMTISLFIVNICSPIFEYSSPLSYNSFTHYIFAVNRA